jgi:protein-S-isoprenylcysteine O-methyltransferase Ste14
MAGALRLVAFAAVVGGVVFAAAGRLDLPFVWGLLGVLVAFALVVPAVAGPDLMRERVTPGGVNRDRLTRPLAAVLLGGHWVLAGLDARFGWTPVPCELRAVGVAGYAAALGVNLWALRANRFYSSAVRVQADRGQQVADTGPYRFVRHPGYTATIFATLAGGLVLGSWVALLPALGFVALFLRRTALEDRMLTAELPGYADYARRVRWRLLPGVF